MNLSPREKDKLLISRSEEHTSELQLPCNLVCRLLLEKKNKKGVYSILHVLTCVTANAPVDVVHLDCHCYLFRYGLLYQLIYLLFCCGSRQLVYLSHV